MGAKLKSHAIYIALLLIAVGQLHAETTWEQVQRNGVLNICIDIDNLPYSSADAKLPGIDVEVVQRLAEGLGVELKFHWLNTLRDSPLADMVRKHCDCVIGVPIDTRAMEETMQIGKRVDFSKPYLGTGYVLVERKHEKTHRIKSLAEVKAETLGVEAGSIAGYVLKQRGYDRRVYRSQIATLNAVQKGQVAYGMLWANAGWLIEKGPPNRKDDAEHTAPVYANLKLVEGYTPEPGFRWNVAIAVRKEEPDLLNAINAVIAEKLTGEQIRKICDKYHLPYYPPFKPTEKDRVK